MEAIIAILLVPLLLFFWHAYRDIRGKTRNSQSLCFSCGRQMDFATAVSHHKGGTFFYCTACASRQQKYQAIGLILMGVAALTALIAVSLNAA